LAAQQNINEELIKWIEITGSPKFARSERRQRIERPHLIDVAPDATTTANKRQDIVT